MVKQLAIRLVIPDAGVLISLAHGNLLSTLFSFASDVDVVLTDVVMYEATKRTDLFDTRRIQDFVAQHSQRISVDPTAFHELLDQARENPTLKLPENLGEISICGYVNAIRDSDPGIPTLIIFEDKWFMDNQYTRPRNTHLLSLAAFLRFLEKVIPDFTFEDAMNRIRNTRPGVHSMEADI